MRANWQKELIAHLDRHKRYPVELKQKTVEIPFASHWTGWVTCSRPSIEKSSGERRSTKPRWRWCKRSDPVPAPPPLIADEGLSFTLPVIFRVKGKS